MDNVCVFKTHNFEGYEFLHDFQASVLSYFQKMDLSEMQQNNLSQKFLLQYSSMP